MDNQSTSTPFDVVVHEDMHGQWIVEAIATADVDTPIRQTRFIGDNARDRARVYAVQKYGITIA